MQLVLTQYTLSSLDPGDWYLNPTVHGVSQVPLNKKIHETNPNLMNEVALIQKIVQANLATHKMRKQDKNKKSLVYFWLPFITYRENSTIEKNL